MKVSKIRSLLLGLSLGIFATPALADDPQKPIGDPTAEPAMPSQQKQKQKQDKPLNQPQAGTQAELTKPKLDTQQVMKITQQAMVHIAAAEAAIERGNTKAAKSALAKSEQALSRLYDTPALVAVLNELDEAISALGGEKQAMKPLDLAPLTATIRSYQAYMDPEVMAGVQQAQQRAEQGDVKGTQEALRLARNRIAIDVALLPVEEAYVRVLAAQQALQTGDNKTAGRLLRNVPIVVSEVQISRPLVPIRFKLHAAAEAAEARQFDKARQLLSEVNRDVQQLESLSQNTTLASELTPIADEIERLSNQAQGGSTLKPSQIREVAKRTRSIGMDTIGEDQG